MSLSPPHSGPEPPPPVGTVRGLASFHLVQHGPGAGAALRALSHLGRDRAALRRTPGLRFWRLLGTGAGASTAPGIDPTRLALFALWEDELALDVFLAASPVVRAWADSGAEVWSVRLRGLGGHGSWRGTDVLGLIEPGHTTATSPVAVLTRADVRPQRLRPFLAAGRPVSEEVAHADGLLAVVAVGEAPVGRQATFSLWASADAARRFAYGSPAHAEVVRRTRAERWYGEELFARFEPYGSTGRWAGRDPLATTGNSIP